MSVLLYKVITIFMTWVADLNKVVLLLYFYQLSPEAFLAKLNLDPTVSYDLA